MSSLEPLPSSGSRDTTVSSRPRRYKGRGVDTYTPEVWEDVYLRTLEKTGNPSRSARSVDIRPRDVQARRDSSLEFDERWREAKQFYLDSVEESLGGGNAAARHRRLMADMPERYSDKVQVAGIIQQAPPAGEIQALLQEIVRSIAPESRAQILQIPSNTDEPEVPGSG